MGMNMFAFGDRFDEPPDIFAVFYRTIAFGNVFERDFMPDGNIVFGFEFERRIVRGDNAQHIRSGLQAFNDDYSEIIVMFVHQ